MSPCPLQSNKSTFSFRFPWSPEQAGDTYVLFWAQADHPSSPGLPMVAPHGPRDLKNPTGSLVPLSTAHGAPPSIPTLRLFLLCLVAPRARHSPHTVPGLYSRSFMTLSPETKMQ